MTAGGENQEGKLGAAAEDKAAIHQEPAQSLIAYSLMDATQEKKQYFRAKLELIMVPTSKSVLKESEVIQSKYKIITK